jgi:IS5 family transposase
MHADKIYRTRENRSFCQARGIRFSGPPLGRPRKVTESNTEQLKQAKQQHRQDELDRIAIEGKFGQAKRRFSLARVMAKLAVTSEVVIMVSFMVMNLEKILSAGLYFWLKIYLWISAAASRAAGERSICTELTLDTDDEYQNVTA